MSENNVISPALKPNADRTIGYVKNGTRMAYRKDAISSLRQVSSAGNQLKTILTADVAKLGTAESTMTAGVSGTISTATMTEDDDYVS